MTFLGSSCWKLTGHYKQFSSVLQMTSPIFLSHSVPSVPPGKFLSGK